MYSYLKNLTLSKVLKKPLLQRLSLLLLFLFIWAWLSWQHQAPLSSNQTQLKLKPEQSKLSKVQDTIIVQKKLDPIQLATIHLQKRIKEKPLGSNRGDSITDWSNKVFGRDGVYWCAIYTSKVLDNTNYYPNIRSARAIAFVTKESYTIKQVLTGRIEPKQNWLAIKSRPGGNHIDFVMSYNAKTKEIVVVGGNVGDKVSMRKVKLSLTDRFGYQFFTPTYRIN